MLESRLSPSLYKIFTETPAPRQITWGDNELSEGLMVEVQVELGRWEQGAGWRRGGGAWVDAKCNVLARPTRSPHPASNGASNNGTAFRA